MSNSDGAHEPSTGIADWLVPVAGAIALIATCVVTSARKYFWHDEVFSWVLVTDPSADHMLRAIAGGAEAAPPLYHLGARLWLFVVGQSELALRLWSSLGFALALLVFWRVLRRSHPPAVAALAAIVPFCTSPLLWYQNAEARFYGTFMLTVALALAATDGAARKGAGEQHHRGIFLAVAVAHAALVLSHIFGFLYSGALFGALVARDAFTATRTHHHAWRWRAYAAIVAAWTVFLLWIPAFLAQADLGRPHTWIQLPTKRALRLAYGTREVRQVFTVVLILAVVLAVVKWSVEWRRARRSPTTAAKDVVGRGGDPLPWFGASLLLVPVAAYIVSHLFMSIFVDRYMLPSLFGTGIIIASALGGLGWAWRALGAPATRSSTAFARYGAIVGSVVLLAQPVRWAFARPQFPVPGAELVRLAREVGEGTPVITESPLEFLPAVHYSGAPSRPFFFVLDWESALEPDAALQATVDYKLMFNWRKWGYLSEGIVESRTALCDIPQFLVVDEPGRLWFDRRIATDPSYEKQLLAAARDSATGWWREKRIIFVRRRVPRDPACGVARIRLTP